MENLLFEISEIETSPKTEKPKNFCRECLHRERWQCGGTVIQYCRKRKSNRTENGLLKIRCKNAACGYFEIDC